MEASIHDLSRELADHELIGRFSVRDTAALEVELELRYEYEESNGVVVSLLEDDLTDSWFADSGPVADPHEGLPGTLDPIDEARVARRRLPWRALFAAILIVAAAACVGATAI